MTKNWEKMWLKYEKKDIQFGYFQCLALENIDEGNKVIKSAISELELGLKRILGASWKKKIYFDAFDEIQEKDVLIIRKQYTDSLYDGGYHIWEKERLYLEARTECGILYGVFDLLRMLSLRKSLVGIDVIKNPEMPLRMLNHWDNMDGSIERGYSGESFFFRENGIVVNERTRDYARMISSIGINAVVINNVNVMDEAKWLITKRHMKKLNELSTVLYSYGIRTFLSLNFMSPVDIGGLDNADPCNDEVRIWWEEIMGELFENVKGLGGFLIKADSEGRPGPYLYGRTQADGANMLAKAVEAYHGIIIWRCFVYNNMQDWRDYKTDRAKAGYDNFNHTDGKYLDNVILQIKNGPMDFQVREPVSPLLGSMKRTNQMLEVQLAQEYTGHQIDLCYLVPLIKEVFAFRTYYTKDDTVADMISGRAYGNHNTGIAAVSNTGNGAFWTGNPLAALNLYGFGRLSFDSKLTAEEIADEWIRLSLTGEEKAVNIIKEIVRNSRETYEKYTSPLGIGWMVMPGGHYGCCVDGYEYSRFGTYHRADHWGIGIDRTERGTGFTKQYHEINCKRYEDIHTCPEELLLFFHYVPYHHILKSGKTVIQHIYDTHFEGVDDVEHMIELWKEVKEYIENEIWEAVSSRFQKQLLNAKEWRDQVNSYFYRKSGIKDLYGRKIY